MALMEFDCRSLQIVQATADHLDLAVPLFDRYRRLYGQVSDLNAARSFLSERIHADDAVLFLVLLEQPPAQLAIGFTLLYQTFCSVELKRVWVLHDLFVIPEARMRGVGRILMATARALSEKTKSKGIVLEADVANLAAQSLYEDLGYRRDAASYRYHLEMEHS